MQQSKQTTGTTGQPWPGPPEGTVVMGDVLPGLPGHQEGRVTEREALSGTARPVDWKAWGGFCPLRKTASLPVFCDRAAQARGVRIFGSRRNA